MEEVNISDSQGVQVGNDNLQVVHVWQRDPRVDASSLGNLKNLNQHEAVEQLRAMDHRGAVRSLGAAETYDAQFVLDLLLTMNEEGLAASLLADLSPDKAAQLIEKVTARVPGKQWLQQLPKAAKSISDLGAELAWDRGSSGQLECVEYYHLVSRPSRLRSTTRHVKVPATGFRRTYKDGCIYWGGDGDAQAISGVMLDHYLASDKCGEQFGIPTEKETLVMSSDGYWVQRFSIGAIYRHESTVMPVEQPVVDYLIAHGGVDQFYPLGEKTSAEPFREQSRGWRQEFKRSGTAHSETIFYIGKANEVNYTGKAYGVSGEIASYYDRLDGAGSWLGYPRSNATYFGSRSRQDFEGGTVFAGIPEIGIITVPIETIETIQAEKILGRIGFPVTKEEGAGRGIDKWQFFENGVVTVRNGIRKVWLRP